MKDKIINLCGNSSDILTRSISINNQNIDIIFCETLTNSSIINQNIIKPLLLNDKYIITSSNFKRINSLKEASDLIFMGFTTVIINNKDIFCIETKKELDRSINESTTEGSISGPKDSFIENFNTNIGLIRKRIRNSDLRIDTLTLGHISNTKIGICYINSIVDKKLLNKTKAKLKRIENDIINDGLYIKEQLSKKSLFPEVNQTERPDLATYSLLEGKLCIIVDNSPTVLIIPTFFIDFFHTADDYYQKNTNVTFTRILRFFSFIIAIFLPGYYISITNNSSMFIEILLLTISFEILRESEIRIPNKFGGSASILGGLILGDAAVEAGVVSPIMIIIVALSMISSFVFSYNSIVHLIRYYRFFILVLCTIFGLYGLFIGLFILITNISSVTSFGYPYTYPFDPLIMEDLKDSIIKLNTKKRNPLLTKNKYR